MSQARNCGLTISLQIQIPFNSLDTIMKIGKVTKQFEFSTVFTFMQALLSHLL